MPICYTQNMNRSRGNSTKNQEVEIRARLSPSLKRAVTAKLNRLGAKSAAKQFIADYYFCPANVRSFRQIEMNKIGSYSLRLREKTVGKSSIFELNMKIITKRGDHNSWRECETPVGNLVESRNILTSLGFKNFFSLIKTRYPYQYKNFHVCLEDIKNFGSILEIEVLTDSKNSDKAKSEIKNFLAILGVDEQSIVPKSITNIIMKQSSRF